MQSIGTNEYIKVVGAVRKAFKGKNLLLAEFDRAREARGANGPVNPEALLLTNPVPMSLEELTEDQVRILVQRVGPDFMRLRTIPLELTLEGNVPVIVGGSCAIESWGMRIIEMVKHNQREAIPLVAKDLISMAPTWTQVTGALLTGADVAIHYWEDRLWAQRLSEWGVRDAHEKVTAAYRRIHDAVDRRARLINPSARLIEINFDDLDLREGPIQRWCQDLRMPYNPDFGIAQVMYTYVGPEILSQLRRAIRRRHPDLLRLMEGVTHHVRLKQIDHNDWDSGINDLKSVILGGEPDEHQGRLLEQYPYQFGVNLAHWVRAGGARSQALVGGFFDMPGDGQVQHLQQDVWGARTTLEQLASPVRLNAENLEQHLRFLEAYLLRGVGPTPKKDEGVLRAENERAKQLSVATSVVAKAQVRLQRHKENLPILNGQAAMFQSMRLGTLINGKDPGLDKIIDRVSTMCASLERKEERTEEDNQDFQDTKTFLQAEWALREGRTDLVKDLKLVEKLADVVPREAENVSTQIGEWEARLLEAETVVQAMSHSKPAVQRDPLEQFTRRLWPLSTNPFVWYATQFIWDADFREFLINAVELQEAENDREQKWKRTEELQALCIRIFPKLQRYLTYILRGDEYPADIRRV